MRASTASWLPAGLVLGLSLLLAPSASRADVVTEMSCSPNPARPQCSNRIDDEPDGTVDSSGGPDGEPMDTDCVSPGDDDEATSDFQPQLPICRDVPIRIVYPQAFLLFTELCPECNWIELIDLNVLKDALKSLPKDWEVTFPLTLSSPLPGVVDDPKLANLRLHYVGKSKIIGPASLGTLSLREPFRLPESFQYVGRAFDMRTGKSVTNVGTARLPATRKPTPRSPVPLLALALALGLVAVAVWRYLATRK